MASTIKKKSIAKGSKFSYKYADLAAIHEELEAQNIRYYQYTKFDEAAKADYIYTVLQTKDGDSPERRGARIVGSPKEGGLAQAYGSALTYARKYSLLMALGWATEDDDGVMASNLRQNEIGNGVNNTRRASTQINFGAIKQNIMQLKNTDEVEAARKSFFEKNPGLTEKQRVAVEEIFNEGLIHVEEQSRWRDA